MAELESIRRMPYSIEAEQAILGTILMDPQRYDEVSFLTSKEFYLPQHQQIFSAISGMFLADQQVDLVTLIAKLTQTGSYTEGDAAKYLKTLVDLATTASNIAEYAKIVRDKALLRMLIEAMQEISEKAFSEVGEVSDLLDLAQNRIFEVTDHTYGRDFEHVRDVILKNYDTLQLLKNDPNALAGLQTNFGQLDHLLVGLGGGDLVVVGARPGMGKTSFVLNIAANVAKYAKKAVAIFSMEMRPEQLSQRLLCSEAMLNSRCMRTGRLADDEWERLGEAMSALSATDIWIDYTPDITVSEMKSKLRKLKNLGLIVIDYLQLMHSPESVRGENRVQEIGRITRSLKIMAMQLGVPLILCSQLSRGTKEQKEGSKKPTLTDLRESGSIEQDADVVMFLHRAEYYRTAEHDVNSLPDYELCDCIVEKNRHGAPGNVRLKWCGQYFRFMAIDDREESGGSEA